MEEDFETLEEVKNDDNAVSQGQQANGVGQVNEYFQRENIQ